MLGLVLDGDGRWLLLLLRQQAAVATAAAAATDAAATATAAWAGVEPGEAANDELDREDDIGCDLQVLGFADVMEFDAAPAVKLAEEEEEEHHIAHDHRVDDQLEARVADEGIAMRREPAEQSGPVHEDELVPQLIVVGRAEVAPAAATIRAPRRQAGRERRQVAEPSSW